MKSKNGRPLEIEDAVPGYPRIGHLAIHRACERFFAKRGMRTAPSFRRSEFLFGRMAINQRRAAA